MRIKSSALGAQAIHPGYGFLSENAHFARACRKNGLVFIGPDPESMERLSDKAKLKELIRHTGLSVIPGSKAVFSVEEAKRAAERIGYPVMLKACAGGGGRTVSSSSSRTTRRTVDVRSEGTLSLQELRLGVRPFWKATRWLSVRADAGLLATYSEIETTTRLSVAGAPAAAIRRDDDDWTLGGYAGLSLGAALTSRLELSS